MGNAEQFTPSNENPKTDQKHPLEDMPSFEEHMREMETAENLDEQEESEEDIEREIIKGNLLVLKDEVRRARNNYLLTLDEVNSAMRLAEDILDYRTKNRDELEEARSKLEYAKDSLEEAVNTFKRVNEEYASSLNQHESEIDTNFYIEENYAVNSNADEIQEGYSKYYAADEVFDDLRSYINNIEELYY
jgi:exonuclease VII small subunit